MAYLRTDRIILRVREIVEDGLAQYRTIATGSYGGDLPTGLSDYAELRRALEIPRVNVSMPLIKRAAESPPSNGSILIYDINIELRLIRLIDRGTQLTEDDISTVQALATQDADVCAQALEYVRNMRFTAAGLPTGMIGLKYSNSKARVVGNINNGAQKIETIHYFTGKAVTVPQVDVSIEIENPQDNPEVGVSLDTEIII